MSYGLKVTAPFLVKGRWVWPTWIDAKCGGNKHAAIIEKGEALGATAWDFGQADTELVKVSQEAAQ